MNEIVGIYCPKCKSPAIVKSGMRIRRGGLVQSYACKTCGHRFVKKST